MKSTAEKQPEIELACGTCARWTQCGDMRMPDHGECEYRAAWQYSHRRSSCLLTPSSWMMRHVKK